MRTARARSPSRAGARAVQLNLARVKIEQAASRHRRKAGDAGRTECVSRSALGGGRRARVRGAGGREGGGTVTGVRLGWAAQPAKRPLAARPQASVPLPLPD